MIVRPLQLRDRQHWARLRAQLWPEADADELAHETLAHFAGKPLAAAIFVAEDAHDRLVGFLELSLRAYAEGCTAGPVPFVEGWYVAAEARHQGGGRRLMEAAEHWARTRGFKEMGSDTALENGLAQAAHAALGFAEVERRVCLRKAL